MIEIQKGESGSVKRIGMILGLFAILLLVFGTIFQKPRIVSSITTKESAYITVLVPKYSAGNVEVLKEKLVKMCLGNEFDQIKLGTEDRPLAKRLHISVYTSKNDLKIGNELLNFVWE